VIGIALKILFLMALIGSLTKLNYQDLEEEEELGFRQDSSIPSCPKSPQKKDQAI